MVKDNLAYQIAATPKDEIVIDEIPVKWCAVSLSEIIERGMRLEASVYDVEAKQAYMRIKNGLYPAVDLIGPNSPVKKAHYGGRLKRNYVEKNEETTVGFIGSSEMLDVSPQPVKFMIDDDRVSELHVKRGTVLISRSGTIGNMSFVNETLEKFLISEHAMRLECNNFPGYVYAYLKTKTGQALIRSNIYGSVIQQIEPEHLASIPIPNAPNEIKAKIDSMIVESYALRDESNHLINEATNLLIDELQLPAINEFDVGYFKKDAPVKTFSVKLSDMDYRLDASYHVPIVDAIIDHLNKHAEEVITVDDNRISKNIILPGRFKRVYVGEGEGRVFIGGKQLHELDPSNKKYLSLSQHGERIEKQLGVRQSVSFAEVAVKNANTLKQKDYYQHHYECSRAHGKMKTVVTIKATGDSVFCFEQDGYDIDVLRQQSGFIGLTQRQKEQCEECYRELTPYHITSVLASGEATKQMGAYNFINDAGKISEAIVIILYMLRCCLAHGDISPDESANEVYKYAYEVLCAPLRKLK